MRPPVVWLAALVAGCALSPRTPPPLEFQELDSPAPEGSRYADLAADPDGSLWLSRLEERADGSFVLAASSLGSQGWSQPLSIAESDSFFVNWADFPSLRPLGEGRLAAHWLHRRGEGSYAYDVMVSLGDRLGSSWSLPVSPHRDGSETEHGFVSLIGLEGGRLGVVWLDGRELVAVDEQSEPSGDMKLMYAVLDPETGRFGEETCLDERVCECCQTSAARTAGGLVVAYRDRSAEEVRDVASLRLAGGRWSEPRLVHADGWEIAACPVNGPAVDARGDRVVVAWFTAAADRPRVELAFSDDGGAHFDSPLRVDTGDPAGRVDVVWANGQSVVVSWLERGEGKQAEVRARSVFPSGPAGPPALIARTRGARSSGFPRLVAVGGFVYAAWTDPGPPIRVRLARADLGVSGSSGTP